MLIALIGNQNSGKTTLFNRLTGDTAKVGNWPGVTIEKRSGFIKGTSHEIVDLPGIYSLSPYTIEEKISRNFIFNEKPDIIINVVDSTSLERSLYLTTELLELDCKVIVALNMVDSLQKLAITLDSTLLSRLLNVKIVETSALTGTGIQELIRSIDSVAIHTPYPIFNQNFENIILKTENSLNPNLIHKRFIAIKLLEEDEGFNNYSFKNLSSIIENTRALYSSDLVELIATKRYNYIENILSQKGRDGTPLLHHKGLSSIKTKLSITDRLDKIFLNKFFGFPIFFIIMFLVYFLSVGMIGKYASDKATDCISYFSSLGFNVLNKAGISEHLTSLVVDGIIAGVGSVVSFVPELFVLFLCLSLLETSGYMSRVAMLFDSIFRKIGLSGKSLIPFIVGSGCSVPGIMSSRIIENNDERKITAILTPFIPCSAKLPIIVLFSSCFFGEYAFIVAASLYLFAIFIIIFSSTIFKKFIFKNTSSTYMLELPQYRIPSIKYVLKDVVEKVLDFIRRAGSIILLCSVALWLLLSFTPEFTHTNNIEQSLLAYIGNKLSWFLYPFLGVKSWSATVSCIQGLIAKEQVISSMSVISGFANTEFFGAIFFGASSPFSFFTTSSAYSYMVFNLFSAPCIAAISAMHKELQSAKTTFFAIVFQIGLAYIFATLVFQFGRLLENKTFNFFNFVIICIIIAIISKIIIVITKNKHSSPSTQCSKCRFLCAIYIFSWKTLIFMI